jgi:hypothetical protein
MPPPIQVQKTKVQTQVKTNPLSLRNVEKAKSTLALKNGEHLSRMTGKGNEPEFVYFKFNPQELNQEQFLALENDSTVMLMEIPFANMSIYNSDFALDESRAEQLKDGNVYGVTTITNTNILTVLSSRAETQTQYLDTLVQIAEEDTTLQFQAMREAGLSEEELDKFRICLFKKPHGYVRYWDNDFNRFEPVRTIMVWSLYFGIPIYSYTDENGYYEIPWRYSIGTIMGTKAKNPRVTVKPLDTHSPSLLIEIPTIIAQFIVGSVHVYGWVTPCQMKDGKDFNYTGHTQVRYWSQILNAYYFHDQYTRDDNIQSVPVSGMVCYAHWAKTGNFIDFLWQPDFGQASTWMLGHITLTGTLIEAALNGLFDGEINLASDAPNLFQLLWAIRPDMTFRVPQAAEPQRYNARFAQIAFHELGHASHFMQVGNLWWANLGLGEIPNRAVPGNPYGDGTYQTAGYVSLAESWAEFIGMNYQQRRYPAAAAFSKCTRDRTYIDGTSGSNQVILDDHFYPSSQLIENQFFFFGGGDWIPMGLYHDLMDNTNVAPNNNSEYWDAVQGVTIRQMYQAFGPNVNSRCDYYNSFVSQNPGLNLSDVFRIFQNHNAECQ